MGVQPSCSTLLIGYVILSSGQYLLSFSDPSSNQRAYAIVVKTDDICPCSGGQYLHVNEACACLSGHAQYTPIGSIITSL
jgi:hypothetical protein